MSEPFLPDPEFGEVVVSANAHYDPGVKLWYRPWTNKPGRVVIGYVIDQLPLTEGEHLGYTYLTVDVEAGVVRWHNGPFGDPERDPIVHEMPYR